MAETGRHTHNQVTWRKDQIFRNYKKLFPSALMPWFPLQSLCSGWWCSLWSYSLWHWETHWGQQIITNRKHSLHFLQDILLLRWRFMVTNYYCIGYMQIRKTHTKTFACRIYVQMKKETTIEKSKKNMKVVRKLMMYKLHKWRVAS